MNQKTQIKLIIAIVGIITVFLPWYRVDFFVAINASGIQSISGVLSLLGFGAVIASLFVEQMKKYTHYIAIAPAVTVLIGLLNGISYIGFGLILALLAAGALLAYCMMNKEA